MATMLLLLLLLFVSRLYAANKLVAEGREADNGAGLKNGPKDEKTLVLPTMEESDYRFSNEAN